MKLCLMKQFLKVLATDGDSFEYLILAFLSLSIKQNNIKPDLFDGSQIQQPINDEHFIEIFELEKNACLSFKDLVKNFL